MSGSGELGGLKVKRGERRLGVGRRNEASGKRVGFERKYDAVSLVKRLGAANVGERCGGPNKESKGAAGFFLVGLGLLFFLAGALAMVFVFFKTKMVAWWQYIFYAFSATMLIVNFLKDWVWAKSYPISPLLNRTLTVDTNGNYTMAFANVLSGTITLTESSGSFGTQQWLVGGGQSKLLGSVCPNAPCSTTTQLNYDANIKGYRWVSPTKLPSSNFTATVIYAN